MKLKKFFYHSFKPLFASVKIFARPFQLDRFELQRHTKNAFQQLLIFKINFKFQKKLFGFPLPLTATPASSVK
jgi:hypothetical protein